MSFYVRMAWRSMRQAPGLNLVMIIALALGIGTLYAQRQVFSVLRERMPAAPADLYLVTLERSDAPTPSRPRDIVPLLPSIVLTPRDAQNVLAADPTRRQTITFGAPALVERDGAPAETVRVRYATRDLFALFQLPLIAGELWPASADEGLFAGTPADAVLLDERYARRVFGKENAIGKRLRIDGAAVRVVGVVGAPGTRYRLYERFVPIPESVYLPLAAATAARAAPDFEHAVAGGETGSAYAWVELPDEAARAQLVAHVEAYLARERASGRAGAPHAVTLRSAVEWRDVFRARGTIKLWPLLSGLCLVACVVNLVRMLIVKCGGRAQDLGVLRAFGARRSSVMAQLLLEAMMIGLVAGVIGVVLGLAMMPIAAGTQPRGGLSSMIGVGTVLTTLGASVGAALLAALYPAWRIARGTPAAQMRNS